ncbi:unnamed protein product, partial [Prorocentrum cordatum]
MAQASCLVIQLGGGDAPPGLGEPWRVMEVGDRQYRNRQGVKTTKPFRSWIEPMLQQASPRQWAACPDVIAVVPAGPLEGGPWPPSWQIDAGWEPGQPALTLTPDYPMYISMVWCEDGHQRTQRYRR